MVSQLTIVCIGTILFISDISTNNLVATMSIVALISFKIIPALNKLGNALNKISESYIFSKVINDINSELQLQIQNYEKPLRKQNNSKWDKIVFKNVSYKYPGADNFALKNLNLEIKKGLHYGFVGFSGSGKTTTIDILNGLLTPTKGDVFIDDFSLPLKKSLASL